MGDLFDADPRLDDRDTVVIFEADIPKYAINAKGRLVLTLEVVDADKYLAMPITDIQGRRFTIRAYAATTRAPDSAPRWRPRVWRWSRRASGSDSCSC